jgi:hypothetical protein
MGDAKRRERAALRGDPPYSPPQVPKVQTKPPKRQGYVPQPVPDAQGIVALPSGAHYLRQRNGVLRRIVLTSEGEPALLQRKRR